MMLRTQISAISFEARAQMRCPLHLESGRLREDRRLDMSLRSPSRQLGLMKRETTRTFASQAWELKIEVGRCWIA